MSGILGWIELESTLTSIYRLWIQIVNANYWLAKDKRERFASGISRSLPAGQIECKRVAESAQL
ncbi:hypothetical protein DBR45_15825 [Pseudomonas sp. HMWF031]|nr:hypothetical protein DBR45_15825 [Pseudomonas sp. HMWF031]